MLVDLNTVKSTGFAKKSKISFQPNLKLFFLQLQPTSYGCCLVHVVQMPWPTILTLSGWTQVTVFEAFTDEGPHHRDTHMNT